MIQKLYFNQHEHMSEMKRYYNRETNSATFCVIHQISFKPQTKIINIYTKLFNIESFTFVHSSEMEENSARS